MIYSPFFPSLFARRLCKAVGIEVEEYNSHLQEFQQMALVCDFEDALIAFVETELTPPQLNALKVIYKHTRPWALGCVVGQTFNDLQHDNKSAEASKTILGKILNSKEVMSDVELNKLLGGLFGQD